MTMRELTRIAPIVAEAGRAPTHGARLCREQPERQNPNDDRAGNVAQVARLIEF
jgi:hypothetical protein